MAEKLQNNIKQNRWLLSASLVIMLVLLISVGIVISVSSQTKNSKDALVSEKKRLEKDIEYTNNLLSQTKKNKEVSLNQLTILNSQIYQRENLINNISSEIGGLDGEIKGSAQIIEQLSNNLMYLKEEYAKIIYSSYKNRNEYSRLMFLFSAKDFNQAYLRLKFLQKYREYRQKQIEMILKTQELLGVKVNDLKTVKQNKQQLLLTEEKHKEELAKEKDQKSNNVKKLQSKEKELVSSLKDKEKSERKLKQAIENIITTEISKSTNRNKSSKVVKAPSSKNKDKKKDKKKDVKEPESPKLYLNEEEQTLSNSFEANKGILPWPLDNGVVTGSFGEHPHPVLQGIKVKNNGIDISTNANANAKSVFDGVVTGIISIPGSNKAVIIRHGDFLSVYSNLSSVNVKSGEKIKVKQPIGTVFTNTEEGKTELHFEIWNDKTLQNPTSWLSKRK
ncbi:MAG: peptidoglycan DD-metalloendopeptidase family protein [Bacteroidetes bacterium]|nr:peptidoglycan DD-metalloendopeptidase family protein [Bacteroidota bacterium]